MKSLFYRFLLFFLVISFFLACSGGSDTPDTPLLEAPQLMGSTPTNGATDVSASNISIVLTFNQNVTAPTTGHDKITLSGATITSVLAYLTKVTIEVTGLEKGKTYTLRIPEGVILGPSKVEAPEISISFTTSSPQQISNKLCTTNPLTQAQNVYDFLIANYGTKIVSGTMASDSWNVNEAEWVFKHTGKYPALNGFDYGHLYASPANWIDYGNTTIIENWWNNHGLVAATWHWNVPKSSGSTEYGFYYTGKNSGKGETSFDISKAVQDGTSENQIVKADLAKIADYLLLLKAKNIPVIWRPLHEAAGGWFWWGAKGATSFKALWKLMFETFQSKGVSNLIWVWTSETGDEDWYPGDAYVDIVGRDVYNKTLASQSVEEFRKLSTTYSHKLITLSECGNVSKISLQWSASANWSWFMPWYDYSRTNKMDDPAFNETSHQFANIEWWKDALNTEAVLSRDEMPDLR